MRTVGAWAVAALLLGFFAGCARDGGPTTHPVKGKVVAPGGRAWAGGTVTFRSVSDPGTLATGDIQPDGTFTLAAQYLEEGRPRTRPGAVAGEYAVEVSPPAAAADRDGPAAVAVAQKYTVRPGDNDFTVEARKPPGR